MSKQKKTRILLVELNYLNTHELDGYIYKEPGAEWIQGHCKSGTWWSKNPELKSTAEIISAKMVE